MMYQAKPIHSSMMHVVLVMLLIAGTGLLPVAESAAVCPPANVLYPCTCTTHNTLLGLRLNCGGKNLGDAALSKILDSVVYQNGVECQLNDFYANDNQLTVFPHQLRLCPRLGWVVLDNNNIRTIPAGAFHLRAVAGLPRPIFYFKIQFNGLKSVAPCAFLGDNYGDGTQLWLSYNSLTRFESGAYKSVLEQMFASGGRSFPNWDNSRPTGLTTFNMGAMYTFDCTSDPCHYAWLIRNPNLKKYVHQGTCANSNTYIADQDPNKFTSCPP